MSRQPTRVESVQNSLNSFNITDAYTRTGSSPSDGQSRGDSPHNQVESVLALYSYVSEKPYSLPLQKGDVINVISKLPSGWWDGVNAKGQRGWFPSNFTQPLPKQPPPPPATTTTSQESMTSSSNDTGSSSVSSFPPRLSDGLVPTNESIDPFTQSTPSHLGLSPAMNNGIMTFEINENDEYDTNQKFDDPPPATSVQTIPAHKSEFHKAKQHTSIDEFDDTSSINSSYHSPSRRGSAQSSNSYMGSSSEQLRKDAPPSGDYLNSYKLVDAKTQDYGTTNPHWIPQVSANGKICYVNPEKKHVAADLPFTPVDTTSNDSEKVVQTMKVSAEVAEQPCNIPNLNEPTTNAYQETYAPHPSGRSSIDSRFSQSSKAFPIQGLETQTWSGLFAHLREAVNSMNHAYNKWDELGLVSRYNDVASTVQTMNLMAGIPPGTLPSSATNSEIAVLFRGIMSVLSKLGLLCDLTSIKRRPSAASVASSSNNAVEKRSTVSINSDMFLEMSIKIVEDCEKFIDLYKSLLRSEHQQLAGAPGEETDAESAEDKIQQPEGIYPVKHYKDGIWTDINVTNNGQVTDQSSSVSLTPSAVSGFGITTPSTTRNSSLFVLESFESTEPLNQETVSKLKERQSGLNEAVDRLLKLISTSEKEKWTLQTIQDRKRIVSTALHNVYNILSSIFYLVETMDLSIYYGGQRRLMLHRSSRASPGTEAFLCLSLIYEFLDAKQSLYVGLVDVIKAQKQTDSSNGDFITTLSQQLDHDKVVEVYLAYEKSVEDGIREKVGKLGDVMGQVVKISGGLSEEQASFAARPITSSYAAGMITGHRNSSAGIASSENTSGELKSPVKIRNDSGATNTEVTSASSSFKDDDVPWYLQLEYGDEMIYDRKGSPRGGSIRALVEQLTHHDKLRPDFNTAMLLTFRSFTDARELFDLLVDRFSIQPPEGLTPEEFQIWTDKKQKPIRIRVINILKTWLENYWLEDDVDEGSINNSTGGSSFMSTTSYAPSVSSTSSRNLLLDSMNKFAVQLNNRKFPGASTLLNLIDQRTRNKEPSFKRIKSNPSPKPPPVLPKSLKKIHLLDIDPTEMARQLTLREFKLYVVITAQECLNRGCGNRGSKSSSSGSTTGNQNKIGEFIHNSNQLTNWVSYMILKHSEAKKRAATIKVFVEVSDFCRDMNNFSSMTAIISGLYSSTIHRMKKTWELVPTKTRSKLDNMNQLMNSTRNFNDYRDMLSSICPPAVPFFGVYLTDLTFTEDGNPDHLQNDSRIINFAKRMKAASTIESIRQFQQMPYNFEEIPEIQAFLKHGFETAPPIEEQYNTSLNMEPRGKPGQDKVAKLLEENGIL